MTGASVRKLDKLEYEQLKENSKNDGKGPYGSG